MIYHVILPASGLGKRFRSRLPKQFHKIDNREIIAFSLIKFNSIREVGTIVIPTFRKYFSRIEKILKEVKIRKNVILVEGGVSRKDSVYNGLNRLNAENNDFVFVHDAVRPFITVNKINEMMKYSKRYNSVILALPVRDTLKMITRSGVIDGTIDRRNLWMAQTPQLFRYRILKDSFEKAKRENFFATDESQIVEHAGYKVKVIEGEVKNIKITTKEDLIFGNNLMVT
ncbi:MAG: 2-C-methyl-D-erythritol 4-phosphate cytidylyltransferase [Ignavibacteria bacterium]|nr:2-C-methyl-D-erythritol 4-phosphate cytidylyltransferase [Ignavibacteria bacterium]